MLVHYSCNVQITSLRPQPVQLNITFEAVDLEGVGNNGGWVLSGSSTIGDCRNDFLNIFVGSNFQEQIGIQFNISMI